MNKIIVLISILASAIFFNCGLSMNTEVVELSSQIEQISIQNDQMQAEISSKQLLAQKPPVEISKAYSLVINDIRYLEGNSGTSMNLMIEKSKENEDISGHYIDCEYRGIKKLPVTIQVDKFSSETDMGAVLNDIYQLEVETDFKAVEINMERNTLMVKGEVYGL